MSSTLESRVWDALKTVRFQRMSRDIVAFGFVRSVELEGSLVAVTLEIATRKEDAVAQLKRDVEAVVVAVEGVGGVAVEVGVKAPKHPAQGAQKAVSQDRELIPEVRHVIAVASGKGGVGKSTVASNLAVSLAAEGYRVGLMDADVYGPSVPILFGIAARPKLQGEKAQPFQKYGVKVMSLGFLLSGDTPVIWRGPMVMKALEQLLGDVEWGALDYLILDLPPGTGDAQLTLSQRVPMAGAVVVSTPQDVALVDARKGFHMFRKVRVPILGIVENMSGFVCPKCGEATDIFKKGGAGRTAEDLGARLLGEIPLDPSIVRGGDSGEPIVVQQPEGAVAEAFRNIARAVVREVDAQAQAEPQLTIS
ncbi:MAG: Mrp/NBP35 family ATP-binding protein [Acidobacteriota bacterium]